MDDTFVWGAAAAIGFAIAFFVGWETRTWWAVTWPLLITVGLTLVGLAWWGGLDQEECYEGCEFVFAFVFPALSVPPVAVWIAGALTGRLRRRAQDRRLGVTDD